MPTLDEARAAVLAAAQRFDRAQFDFVEGNVTLRELGDAERALETASEIYGATVHKEAAQVHHCKVFSARIGLRDPDVLDISRKSAGRDGLPFAPSWELLAPVLAKRRAGTMTRTDWEDYDRAYTKEMVRSYQTQRAAWDAVLARSRVVLTCYCTDSTQCHRVLLRAMLAKLGAHDCGELAPPPPPQRRSGRRRRWRCTRRTRSCWRPCT